MLRTQLTVVILCCWVGFYTSLHLADHEKKCDFTSPKIWKVCGNASTTNESCVNELHCCVAPDKFLQQHNTSSRCYKPSSSGGKIGNGTCVEYTGQACGQYFNDSSIRNLTNSQSSLRYIDANVKLEKTDYIIGEFFKALKARLIKKECLDILSPAMCQYIIPACVDDDTKNEPQAICREDCEHVLKICSEDYKRLIGAIQYIAIKENVDFSHLVASETCRFLSYAWEYDSASNKTCSYLVAGLDRSRPVLKPGKEKGNIALYIAVAAAAVLVITLVAVLLVIRHLKRKRKRAFLRADSTTALTMTSVRDRIRQDNRDSVDPLLELLANSKPGELVQYPLDCVEYIKDLGEGQFGKVFQGRVHGIVKGEESSDVAVKCLKEGSSSQAVEAFHQEVRLMSCLQHDNILRLLAVSTEEEPYCMIFEFMDKGDLNEFLRKAKGKEQLGDSELIKVCKQVASGMEYLASKKFLHRDLATRNCLVGTGLIVKIADFGMSRNIYHSDYYRVGGEAMLPIRWMPPEAILYGKFTVAADIYSFGVVLWEIFSFALQPFYGYSNEEVIEFIKKGVLLPQPEDCPEWIYSIMLGCWKREPEERMSFTETLKLLKGQFPDESNYDSPPKRDTGYNVVQAVPKTTTLYDTPNAVKPTSSTNTGNEGIDPRYKNLKYDDKKNDVPSSSSSKAEPTVTYQNIKPGAGKTDVTFSKKKVLHTKNQEKGTSQDVDVKNQPSLNHGASNSAYDNDVDDDDDVPVVKMLDNQDNAFPEKRTQSVDKKTSSLGKLRNKMLGRKSAGDIHEKSRTLQEQRRSIKDVLRDHDRYVSTEALKSTTPPEDEDTQKPTRDKVVSGFRPTSEFLEYHGNGDAIQSDDPVERDTIKKIIDTHKHNTGGGS